MSAHTSVLFSFLVHQILDVAQILDHKMVVQMDAVAERCYHRNPPDGRNPLPCSQIAQLVRKPDGTHPSVSAVQECIATFWDTPSERGRKKGWRNNSLRRRDVDANVLPTRNDKNGTILSHGDTGDENPGTHSGFRKRGF